MLVKVERIVLLLLLGRGHGRVKHFERGVLTVAGPAGSGSSCLSGGPGLPPRHNLDAIVGHVLWVVIVRGEEHEVVVGTIFLLAEVSQVVKVDQVADLDVEPGCKPPDFILDAQT